MRRPIRREYVQALAGFVALVAFSLAFGHEPVDQDTVGKKGQVRLAYFPNLTHAPALIAVSKGILGRHLVGYGLRTMVVNAGPDAMEALLAGDLDMAYVGPSPALNTFVKTHGTALRIVGGVCSGGASLVARDGVDIKSVADLANHRVAIPELGGTQDVSLRHFMALNHLAPRESGGTVEILPIKNPDILSLFKRGQLDAAWVPEPWASRLEIEANAKVVVDERDLWPNHRFTTAVIVSSQKFLADHDDAVQDVLAANREAIQEIETDPAMAQADANAELKRLTGKSLKPAVIQTAWKSLSFSPELDADNIAAFAAAAQDAGYLKAPDGLVRQICEIVPQSRLAASR
jgi:NitT/TauT family transport system substrate-binding protein